MCQFLIFGSIGCDLAMKIVGEAKAHKISKTQESFWQIQSCWRDIKIINIFSRVPKSKLKKIKILMGINIKLCENVLNDMDQAKSKLSR